MAYLTCPNCGTSLEDASFEGTARACPSCCASMRPTNEVRWQRQPPPAGAEERRRVRMAMIADEAAPASARGALSSACGDEVEPDVMAVAQLLTSELVTNAVKHSAGLDGGRAEFTVWLSPERLRVEVGDRGRGFRPRPREAGQDIGSGWGLHLVEELSSHWGVSVGEGTHVWFDLQLAGSPA